MDYKIIADSCCDMTPELKSELGITSIPLTLTLGEKSYTDDETLVLPSFMAEMANCASGVKTACHAPGVYIEVFQKKMFHRSRHWQRKGRVPAFLEEQPRL